MKKALKLIQISSKWDELGNLIQPLWTIIVYICSMVLQSCYNTFAVAQKLFAFYSNHVDVWIQFGK